MAKTIYLDYAAATPLDSNVLAEMQPYMTDAFYNPSAPYQPAREVRKDIEEARISVARIIGAKPTEVVFTAGATESINLAFNIGGHMVTTTTEHAAVLQAANTHDATLVNVDEKGRVNPNDIKKAITPKTTIVTVSFVNNETGTIQDLKSIAKIIFDERQKREAKGSTTPLYLHTDASQAAGMLDIHVARLGVDMMTLNGGKIYGPKQTGILYFNSSIDLQPMIVGGGQERGLRSGTENVAGVIGFSKALEIAEKKRKTEFERLENLRQQMLDILQKEFTDIIIIGDQKHHTPHILTAAWRGLDAERVLFALESQNILVATGSACAANKDTRSHVLTALGLEPGIIDASLRFSFGRHTTSDDVDTAAKIIVDVIKQELARGKRIK
ncbi:MAG: cysteine desulfurase family protein [Candidatus Saccharibacteria bacterium]|nr:cysteine desulfurase family protein [Candidatus Saccharibacteria bacterium]